MTNRNYEPLLITAVTGMVILVTAVLLEWIPAPASTVGAASPPASSPAPPTAAEPPVAEGSIASGHDTTSSTWEGLEYFYGSLQSLPSDQTSLHIAYFGDSMIEGDLVTQPLRRHMQQRFGGNGVGFVPLTTPLPGFRTTVRQSFNERWTVISFVHPSANNALPTGLSGYAYLSSRGARAVFEAPKNGPVFHRASLLYGGTTAMTVDLRTDTVVRMLTLLPGRPVSMHDLFSDTSFRSLEITVRSEEAGLMYGVNFEGGPGVYVDNYAFRGNSGLPMTSIPDTVYAGFHRILRNRLLILHFGLNVFTPGVEDYHWYEEAMVKVVRHVRQASPGIPLLIISMPDRASLINGTYATPAGLPGFIRLQKRIALRTHTAFFNLYEAMGGAGSMKRWVEDRPKLAGDDYTHPNGAGAARIAVLVYDYLMRGYDHYLQSSDTLTVHAEHDPAP